MLEINIAIGKSRKTKTWSNQKILWPALIKKLSQPVSTGESYKDYVALGATKEGKEKQADLKDRGGFVGGYLKDGGRHPGNVTYRQLITLDLDYANLDFWEDFSLYFGNAACIHSTHKHSSKTPRYRLIMPIDRKVSAVEYEAIARKLAAELDINLFDPTTFQPERLMYWPTIAKDGEWVFEHQKGEPIKADEILSTYDDWSDISEWPKHEEETLKISRDIKSQGNPHEKPGLIGAFCRIYSIHEVLEEFLSDIYEPTAFEDRYTFIEGSSSGGGIVYDDIFFYSHHSTDPGHNQLLNAFDLLRVHKFGHEDTSEDQVKDVSKRKSYRLMNDFCKTLKAVVHQVGVTKLSASEEFNDGYVDDEYNDAWLGELTLDKFHRYDNTIPNFVKIIKHDPLLCAIPFTKDKSAKIPLGNLRYDKFNLRPVSTKPLPWNSYDGERQWTDEDDAGLRNYLEDRYEIYNSTKCNDALMLIFKQNAFHPITDYLSKLEWDGLERLDTLLIDYMGAEDNQFTRLATRKAFTAAAARVFQPGIKFDYVLTLVGEEGIKKSTILDRMGGKWFSDSFVGVEGNKAYEQLWGAWLIEMGELSGIKRSEAEAVKHFITKKTDRFRVAYGKRVEEFPRQCVFFGSTNEYAFLRDNNGNRRFWPVKVNDYGLLYVEDMPVDQLWAEAVQYYRWGEKLYFDEDVEQEAREVQSQHTERDERTGLIAQYLNTYLPLNWANMQLYQRRSYLNDDEQIFEFGEFKRKRVCVAEIWCELFQSPLKDMTTHNTKYIHAILEHLPGWEKSSSNLTFEIYGKQRAYVATETIKREKRKTKNQTK